MLYISFFGQPRFQLDGAPHRFAAPPKTLPLLAYLLLNRDTALRRESLAFALWPDDTEDDARTDLRRHLNYLKNALPPASPGALWVVADTETVQWNPAAAYALDVTDFERLAAESQGRAAAIELYQGDLLENLYDDWLFPERERLRNIYLDTLSALLLESRSRRDFARAISYAQRIMAAEPWRENTLRQLLMVRYEAGDRAGALRDFDDFQKRLREEMGIDPMPETLSLRNLILRNAVLPESRLSDPDPAALQAAQSSLLLPFAGRDAEFDQLQAMWSRAARGRGGTVLLGGEAGIGKSRLASELALRAGAQGGRILAGGALHPESTPYEPIAQAFRSASPSLASLDIAPVWLAAVAQIVPELRERDNTLPALPELDPARERSRLFEAMAECLAAFAKPRPVLLVLEDLHWASSATMAAIEYLARRAASVNVLIVGTYREEEANSGNALRESRRKLQREGLISHLALARLSEESVRAMLQRIPQLAAQNGDPAKRVMAQSQGNPLFLSEIVRDFIESGEAASNEVPRGLKATISARVERLSQPAQFLAQIASVVGAVFDVDVVNEISGWQEQEVLDALEELVRYHVVRETGKSKAFDFAFSHHLVQLAIYDGTDGAARARWHRRAAHAMQRVHSGRIEEIGAVLARHFDLAGEADQASRYYLQAARNAISLYANDEALALAKRGLELSTTDDGRFELLALCESVHNRQGNRSGQAAVLAELERTAGEANDAQHCDCIFRRIVFHRTLGERDLEAANIEALISRVSSLNDPAWTARAFHARAVYETNIGKFDESRNSIAAAITAYSGASDTRGEVECLCLLAYVDVFQSKSGESESAFARAHEAAQAGGNQALLAHTYLSASTAANIVMDYKKCKSFAERALELYVAVGDREGEADSCARLGVAAGREFDIDTARGRFEKARDLYAALGKKQGLGAVAINSGMMEFALGRVDRASGQFSLAENVFSELGDVRGLTVSAINLAMMHYHQGEFAAATERARQGLSLARRLGSEPLEAAALGNLGAAERELGELEASCAHLQASIDLRRKSGIADATLDVAELALTQIRMGNTAEAVRLADELMALDPAEYAMTWAPQTVPMAAAQAYRALRRKKHAGEAMDLARRLFRERIAGLPDPEGRAAYERIPFNRELCEPQPTSCSSDERGNSGRASGIPHP